MLCPSARAYKRSRGQRDAAGGVVDLVGRRRHGRGARAVVTRADRERAARDAVDLALHAGVRAGRGAATDRDLGAARHDRHADDARRHATSGRRHRASRRRRRLRGGGDRGRSPAAARAGSSSACRR